MLLKSEIINRLDHLCPLNVDAVVANHLHKYFFQFWENKSVQFWENIYAHSKNQFATGEWIITRCIAKCLSLLSSYRAAVDVLDWVAPVLKALTPERDILWQRDVQPEVHPKVILQHFGVDVTRSLGWLRIKIQSGQKSALTTDLDLNLRHLHRHRGQYCTCSSHGRGFGAEPLKNRKNKHFSPTLCFVAIW